MSSISFKTNVYLLILFFTGRCYGSNLRGSSDAVPNQGSNVLCRFTLYDIMSENFENDENTACIPIIDERETDDVIPYDLALALTESDRVKLEQGQLFVNITDAELSQGVISTTPSSELAVVHELPLHLRHLQERSLQSTGELTLAIIRISTSNRSPSASRVDLEKMTNENILSLAQQFDKCSSGKLRIKKAARSVIDVTVGSKTNKARMIQAAQDQVKQDLNLDQMSDLADRVLFCLPPGTGNWIGAATTNHWRLELNDGYCTSLSASMHELGHTIGLPHAYKGSDKYGDGTGYMGRSYPNAAWPKRCFNGVNSDLLGWYADRTMRMSSSDPVQLVRLAGVVDYTKTASNEPVLIKIDNKLVLQYNRYKDFNVGTDESLDSVAITEEVNGNSHFRGFLRPGETYRFGTAVISVCERASGVGGGADVMTISLGRGFSRCEQLHGKQNPPATPESEQEEFGNSESTPFPTAAPRS